MVESHWYIEDLHATDEYTGKYMYISLKVPLIFEAAMHGTRGYYSYL